MYDPQVLPQDSTTRCRGSFPTYRENTKRILLGLAACLTFIVAHSQTKRALFLGNSYTYYNNLPQMVADMASSVGDSLFVDSHAPGGATFGAHANNSTSLNMIMAGDWDYVVLQGQSLELWGTFPDILASFPQVGVLDSLIHLYSPCAETMFYRTWGRKNGFGATSYQTLDSIIHVNYMKLADSLDAVVSPVGEVWKYIRQHHPSIELYDADESHPSLAGTYAAACSFFTAMFREDPTLAPFSSSLPAIDAADIRNAAKVVAYDSLLNWHIGEYDSLFNAACNPSVPSPSRVPRITIFPNPFSSRTTLHTSTTLHRATLSMVNGLGRTVRQLTNISGSTITLERGDLPSGIYFLRLSNGSEEFVGRVLIAGE